MKRKQNYSYLLMLLDRLYQAAFNAGVAHMAGHGKEETAERAKAADARREIEGMIEEKR